MRYILLMPLVLYSSIPKKKGWVTPRHSWSKHLKPLLVSYDRSILDEFVKLFRHILSRQLPRSPAELLRWNFPISHLVLNLPSLIPSGRLLDLQNELFCFPYIWVSIWCKFSYLSHFSFLFLDILWLSWIRAIILLIILILVEMF